VKWTLFKNGTAVCGNPGTGADSNGNIDAINFAIDMCLETRDLVIFDGVMSSKKLVDHLQTHPYPNLGVIWVHLDVSAETAIQRVLKRRQERGEMEMSEATRQGVLAFRLRAKAIWAYARQTYFRTPRKFVVIPEGKTPAQIYQRLSTDVHNLLAAEEPNIVAA
jgi:thymidylate kinase